MTLYCKRCGGTDIWERTWQNMNTGAIDNLGDTVPPFCRDCDKSTSTVETPPSAARSKRG